MKKKIEKEVKGKEVNAINPNSEENQMEAIILKYYSKLSKRISYLKDMDTTDKLLDFQDAVNEAFMEVVKSKVVIENPKQYFAKAIANNFKHRHLSAPKIENFGSTLDINEDIENASVVNPLGEIVEVVQAVKKCLTVSEYEIFEKYNIIGETMEVIASSIGSNKMEASRKYKRIMDKIDKLKISYFYNSRYASYQGKQGKVNAPYNSEVKYNPKTDRYEKVEHLPEKVVNRKYACLDQVKPANRVLPNNYSGDMVAIKKEVKVKRPDNMKWNYQPEYSYYTPCYADSTLPAFTTNEELLLLIKNRVQYNRYIKSISAVVKENRSTPYFSYGKYMSQDGKYCNI